MNKVVFAVSIAVALAPLVLAPQSPEEVIHDRRAALVTVVRMINTAELEYKIKAGHYGELNDLQNAHLLDLTVVASSYPLAYGVTKSKGDLMSLVPDSASFQLIVSSDRSRYSVAIKDRGDPSNFGTFSDETGLIYTGEPLK